MSKDDKIYKSFVAVMNDRLSYYDNVIARVLFLEKQNKILEDRIIALEKLNSLVEPDKTKAKNNFPSPKYFISFVSVIDGSLAFGNNIAKDNIQSLDDIQELENEIKCSNEKVMKVKLLFFQRIDNENT